MDAKRVFAKLKQTQSKSLQEARREYERRYQRHPPPGFDRWYDAATKADATVIDNFDAIMNAFEPFWGYTGHEVRALTNMATDTKEMILKFSIRNNVLSISQFLGYERYTEEMDRWLQPLLQAKVLPDMDLAYSAEDEPRVVVPYDLLARQKKQCPTHKIVKNQQNMDLGHPITLLEVDKQNIRDIATSSCALSSPARALTPDLTAGNEPLDFIAGMQSICRYPDAATQHGFFSSPVRNKFTTQLLPIFSKAKPRNYQDLHMPSPFYTESYRQRLNDSVPDPPWEEKTNTLFWTGRPTGGYNHDGNWAQLHRHRFVHDMNSPTRQITLLRLNNHTNTWDAYAAPLSTLSAQLDVAFTIKWHGTCTPDDCAWVEENLRFLPATLPESDAFASRFIMDLDGFGFTERFYRFLGSGSTVFKMSMFEEWHHDRLVPWVHYVPVSVDMAELPEMVRFFSTPQGGVLAREIADEGRRWKERVLRTEDIELAVWRILLEWGRLWGEERDLANGGNGTCPWDRDRGSSLI